MKPFLKNSGEADAAFRFRIDDVCSTRGRGVVVTGQVLQGSLCKRSTVDCVTADGGRFSCLVWDIEATGSEPHPDDAQAGGNSDGRYSLWIAERSPDEFHSGDYLEAGMV